jgi:hypothetical protein
MSGDVPADYLKDFNYLKEKSAKSALYNDNAIYKKLDDKARNLPGLRRALNSLSVKFV